MDPLVLEGFGDLLGAFDTQIADVQDGAGLYGDHIPKLTAACTAQAGAGTVGNVQAVDRLVQNILLLFRGCVSKFAAFGESGPEAVTVLGF